MSINYLFTHCQLFLDKKARLEVDKHDFIVLNDEGKFFAYWTSEAYGELDFTGFEDLAIIDIAKYMTPMRSGEVKSLTVAGIKGDGNFHYVCLMNEFTSASSGSASIDNVEDNSNWYKYTPDGKEYYSDWEGNWVENTYE